MKKVLSVMLVAIWLGISSGVCLSMRLSEYYVGDLNGNKVYLLTQFISNETRIDSVPLKTRWGAFLTVKNGDKKGSSIRLVFVREKDGWYCENVSELKRYRVSPQENNIYGRTLDYILNKR